MKSLRAALLVLALTAFAALVLWTTLHRRKPGSTPAAARGSTAATSTKLVPGFLSSRTIGNPAERGAPAWITDLTLVDLDRDGMMDVVACDARANRVRWLRQTAPGEYVEQTIGSLIEGPAHVAAVDVDGDGDLDLLVAGMGVVPPSNDKIGTVVILENDGQQQFTHHVVLERTHRVTDVEAADLNGDGRLDLAVAQFGYLEGQVCWLENQGGWRFAEHTLLDLAGPIHAPVLDVNGDGKPDIVSLVSQDWEEIWAFENQGGGRFTNRVLWGSTNTDYGSSGIAIADIDRDGLPDIAYANGDAFDYTMPGPRPWHGVQWLRNDGRGNFRFHRLGNFSGAYSPAVVDLNGDGFMDIVAVSAFNDWSKKDAPVLVCFENDGRQGFTPRVLAHEPTHMLVVKAADMDGDGQVELVTGCFAFYPPLDRAARIMLWKQRPGR